MTKGKSSSSLNFYQTIDVLSDFERLASSDVYTPLPEDWVVGAADIVGSIQAIHQGRYKVVNTVGAAVISAQINTLKGFEFPFAFGGDAVATALDSKPIGGCR